jgi:PmbA protein
MMEALLEMARKKVDQAEVYSLDEVSDEVRFEDGKLKDIESKSQSGISLRVIRDGKLGFAYTKNLIHPEETFKNALDSLKGGVDAPPSLPSTRLDLSLETYDPSIEGLTNAQMVEEGKRICDFLASRVNGQINLSAGRKIVRLRIINSQGSDLSSSFSFYFLSTEILYPGTYASIHRERVEKRFVEADEGYLHHLLDLYVPSSKEVDPPGGRMKVLFLPESMYVLIWRVESATSGRNVYLKVSPIMERLGEKVFDEKLTIYDDPLNDRLPGARSFDDEGVACRRWPIVEKGVVTHFYYDLTYGAKMGVGSTGHGYKAGMWGGERVSFKPSPSLEHLFVETGEKSFWDLVRAIDRGVIVAGAMGGHSGNIQNGDFSIGLSPGLYVERGEIVGHVKDAMIAGNIFEVMKEVVDLEDTAHPASNGTFPSVLFEGVKVATRSGSRDDGPHR